MKRKLSSWSNKSSIPPFSSSFALGISIYTHRNYYDNNGNIKVKFMLFCAGLDEESACWKMNVDVTFGIIFGFDSTKKN